MISVKINTLHLKKKSSEIRSQASMQNSNNKKVQGLTAPQEKAEFHDAAHDEMNQKRQGHFSESAYQAPHFIRRVGGSNPQAQQLDQGAHRPSAQGFLQPRAPAAAAGKYPGHISHRLKPHASRPIHTVGELIQHRSASHIFKRLNAKKSSQRF